MWLTLTILISFSILLLLPHYLGLPTFIHIPLLILYIFWVPGESKSFRSWSGWKGLRGRFSIPAGGNLLAKKNESGPVMIAVHPHGIYASVVSLFFTINPDFLHLRPVATSIMFYIPIIKEFAGLGGAIRANRETILSTLACGDSVVLCPGGLREIIGLDNERVKKGDGFVERDGFIKIAISKNVPIIPVYVTNVNELYNVWIPFPALQRFFLSKFLYPWPVICWGNWKLPFWPKSLQQEIRVGNPIDTKNFTLQETDDVRRLFYEEMKKLKN